MLPGLKQTNDLKPPLRYLCVLGVSAVQKCAPDLYRRDAEFAEIAQRVSKKTQRFQIRTLLTLLG
jgi:hypothetical protein